MATPQDRSFYVLELSVQPGGSRFAELHAYTDPAHLRAWLEDFCGNGAGLSAYHAIFYGARLGIWTIQQGDVASFLNVYPHIKVRLGDHPPVPLWDDDALRPLIVAERRARLADEDDDEEDEDDDDDDELTADWHDIDLDIYEAMQLRLDWQAIAAELPALTPPLLQPGERGNVRHREQPNDSYLKTGSIRFGSHDRESGRPLRPPFPLPAADEDEDDDDDAELEEEDDDDAAR